MNIEQILNQWKQSKAVHLTHPLKVELQNAHLEAFGESVNTSCGSCVKRALDRLAARVEVKPEKKVNPQVDFDTMTFAELQAYARANGFKSRRSRILQLAELRKLS